MTDGSKLRIILIVVGLIGVANAIWFFSVTDVEDIVVIKQNNKQIWPRE